MADRPVFRAAEAATPELTVKEQKKLKAALIARGADRQDEAALLELASSKKKAERKLAYQALAKLGSETAVDCLVNELGFADEEVVCEALQRFRPASAAEPLVTFAEQKWKQYEDLAIPIGLAFAGVLTACACIDPHTIKPEALNRLLAVAEQAAAIEPEPADPENPYAYIETELEIQRVNVLARGILQELDERQSGL
ncbi:hypothetical protein [Saccharibacillus sacchari]|uniref:Uncharacterized protein n=1 Tax=Saccharibacillus sacchari TaxID=456493 RepID=A0ACC6PBN5_9BACL